MTSCVEINECVGCIEQRAAPVNFDVHAGDKHTAIINKILAPLRAHLEFSDFLDSRYQAMMRELCKQPEDIEGVTQRQMNLNLTRRAMGLAMPSSCMASYESRASWRRGRRRCPCHRYAASG